MDKTFYSIDDHEMIRVGIISFIEGKSDWKCLGGASCAEEALADLQGFAKAQTMPSIIISDLNFNGEISGYNLVSHLHSLYPQQKIIVYSMFFSPGNVQISLRSGASGYVSKDSSSEELLECMERVLNGEQFAQIGLKQKLESYNSFTDALTKREKEVMALLLQKFDNNKIAEFMGVGMGAVYNYISSIYEKTGKDRAELIRLFG